MVGEMGFARFTTVYLVAREISVVCQTHDADVTVRLPKFWDGKSNGCCRETAMAGYDGRGWRMDKKSPMRRCGSLKNVVPGLARFQQLSISCLSVVSLCHGAKIHQCCDQSLRQMRLELGGCV